MVPKRKEQKYGWFGNLSSQYQTGRTGFPDQVIAYVIARIQKEHPSILDVGCGTGISTRQLRDAGAKVVGTDIAPQMIAAAKQRDNRGIEYHIAPAEHQPFDQGSFDAVTVFSSLHWFPYECVINEFKRVLRPDGVLCVINKNDTGGFKLVLRHILKELGIDDLPDAKRSYDPKSLLDAHGFASTDEKRFKATESFSLQGAMNYFQSTSLWNLIPKHKATRALRKLDACLSSRVVKGKLRRDVEIVVVLGRLKVLRNSCI